VAISPAALAHIREAVTSPTVEVGGILIGSYRDRCIDVAAAVSAEPTSVGATHYVRSQRRAQQALDLALKESGELLHGYVGEWHSHPGSTRPSWTDRRQMIRFSARCPEPIVLLIVSTTKRTLSKWSVHVYERRRRLTTNAATGVPS